MASAGQSEAASPSLSDDPTHPSIPPSQAALMYGRQLTVGEVSVGSAWDGIESMCSCMSVVLGGVDRYTLHHISPADC